jgi:hypothetical protein
VLSASKERTVAACQKVDRWITENVLVPVEHVVLSAENVCTDVQRWVSHNVWDEVDSFIRHQDEFCHDLPWPLDWACDVVVSFEKVVTWVPRVAWDLVTDTVCHIVQKVIGAFITFVMRLVSWMVTTLVCLVTAPLDAGAKLLDLLHILTDGIGAIFSMIASAIDAMRHLLDNFDRLLDSLGDSIGVLRWLLTPLKAAAKLANVLLNAARDFVDGIKDVVHGIGNLNPCEILRGASNIGMAALGAGVNAGFGVLLPVKGVGMFYAAARDFSDRNLLNDIIAEDINGAFGAGSDRAQRSIESLNLGSMNEGRRFSIAPYRMYISSTGDSPNLHDLHANGVLNLYALAGYPSSCPGTIDNPIGEVVYADSELPVTFVDIWRYLRGDAESVPEFWVFGITLDRFARDLSEAQKKTSCLGIQYDILPFDVYRARSSEDIPLNCWQSGSQFSDAAQQRIFKELGRDGTAAVDLSIIPVVSHFHYVTKTTDATTGKELSVTELFGMTSAFDPPLESTGTTNRDTPNYFPKYTGVTYRSLSPEAVFRWTVAHELGHYIGLLHTKWGVPLKGPDDPVNPSDRRSFDEIMFSPSSGRLDPGSVLFEFLVAGGEPRFTVGDARQTWNWITTKGRSLLP